MKILILVLSARLQPWGSLMDVSLETWDSENHPQAQTLYYCGKSSEPATDKVFYSPRLDESLENVSSRTIEAFEKALEYDWDYLARPNSSCYVHKKNLVKFCETIPTENAIYGILTEGEKRFMWGGCQYIFSRDVIEKMVANKDKWNHKVMEDISITKMADELDISLASNGWCASINLTPDGSYTCLLYGHGDGFIFTNFEDINKAEGHFYFRCKQDLRRHEDVRIMRELWKHLP